MSSVVDSMSKEVEGRPTYFNGPLVGVWSMLDVNLLRSFLKLSLTTAEERPGRLLGESMMREMLEGGISSSIGDGATAIARGRRGRPPKTSLCLVLLGVAIICTPCAKGFRVGFLGSEQR